MAGWARFHRTPPSRPAPQVVIRGVARLAPQQALASAAAFLGQALAACASDAAATPAKQVALEAAVQVLEAVIPALVGGEGASGAGPAPPAAGAASAAGAGGAAPPPAVAVPAVAEALKAMLQQLLTLRLRDPILVMLVRRRRRADMTARCRPRVAGCFCQLPRPRARAPRAGRPAPLHLEAAPPPTASTQALTPTHANTLQHARSLEAFSRFVALHGDLLVPLVQASFECLQVRAPRRRFRHGVGAGPAPTVCRPTPRRPREACGAAAPPARPRAGWLGICIARTQPPSLPPRRRAGDPDRAERAASSAGQGVAAVEGGGRRAHGDGQGGLSKARARFHVE